MKRTAAGRDLPPPQKFSPFLTRLVLLIWLLALATILEGDGMPPGAMETRLYRLVADIQFNFWGWEAEALWGKFTLWLLQPQRYMTEADRSAFVRDFVRRVQAVQRLEWKISEAYSDPSVKNPDATTRKMRIERERARREIAARQPIAEAIMEEQVGVVLARDASGLVGQPFPPVGIRISPLPQVLIVSLRERITAIHQEELVPSLTTDRAKALEEQVDRTFHASSLVTSIGGMSLWPAMLLEYPNTGWWLEVTAHEWVHHYLYFFPLGWEYDRKWEARVINETVASLVGKEVGKRTLRQYYPDLAPPEEEEEEEQPPPQEKPAEPPAFDFRAEMRQTRIRVDWLLLHGRIEEAEAYMEQRRQVFWKKGYHIRKLNQAYFAFHGSYADEPGAAGADPVGPAVRDLWAETRKAVAQLGVSDLRLFLRRVRGITSLEELQAALDGAHTNREADGGIRYPP